MEKIFGWTGRILQVDLSKRSVSIVPTDAYRDFIGGLGINQYILFKELAEDTDPLSSENLLIFGAGPLAGTPAFSSSRTSIDCKNVLTGGVGSANVGGHFSAELKCAGYDHIVLSGKADQPVVLFIHNDSISFMDARDLWGKGTQETFQRIREKHNDPRIRMAAIGPAGEKGVKFACIIVDHGRAAGFSGGGAVMGSKNVKAIAVRGTKDIAIAHPSFFSETLNKIKHKIESSPSTDKMRRGGTHLISGGGGPDRTRPQAARNLQDEFWSKEKSQKIIEPAFKQYEIDRLACYNCPVRCSHLYDIPDGENRGKQVEGIQANTVRAFSSNLDIADPEVILNANFLCNDLGLDVDGTAVALGWAFECFERGIIRAEDTDGLELNWGNGTEALGLIKKIGLRQGIGDLLAEGVQAAAQTVGQGSEAYAMQIKGAPINESCMRTHKGWALGIITSTRGGGHLRGAPNTEQKNVPSDVSQKIWGIPTAGTPGSYEGKAKLVTWFEAFKAVVDSLGLCYFSTYWRDVNLLGPKELADLLYGATDWRLEEAELLNIGEKIINLEKAFNTLHAGFTRQNDLPPERLMTTSVSEGPFKGEHLDKSKWESMLSEYYRIHNWDMDTGWQTEACLDALNLPLFVKERLKQKNRLIAEAKS